MAEQKLKTEQLAKRRSSARVVLISGIVLLLFGLYISVFMLPDFLRTASGPQAITLEEAAQIASDERTYVAVRGGTWDCNTLTYIEGYSPRHTRYGSPLEEDIKATEIFYVSSSQDIAMLVTLSGEVDCGDIVEQVPSGDLFMMSDNTQRALTNDARLARFFNTDTFLEFCGYCGQENSLIGAVFGIVSLLLGIGMTVYGLKLRSSLTANLDG